MKIAMTGVSGNMGREALKQTLELPSVAYVRVLLSNKKKNNKLAKRLAKTYGGRIQIVRGTVADPAVAAKLVEGVDYVVHMAAVIPPASDASPAASEECNRRGAVAIVNFDGRQYVEEIGREAWGYVEYDREISDQLADDYELVRAR